MQSGMMSNGSNAHAPQPVYVGSINAEGLHWCSSCAAYMPLELFHRNRARRDGYAHNCRVCVMKQRRQTYVRNRDREIAHTRQWQAAHPDKVRAARRTAQRVYAMRRRIETGVVARQMARRARRAQEVDQVRRILCEQPAATVTQLTRITGWGETKARLRLLEARGATHGRKSVNA